MVLLYAYRFFWQLDLKEITYLKKRKERGGGRLVNVVI